MPWKIEDHLGVGDALSHSFSRVQGRYIPVTPGDHLIQCVVCKYIPSYELPLLDTLTFGVVLNTTLQFQAMIELLKKERFELLEYRKKPFIQISLCDKEGHNNAMMRLSELMLLLSVFDPHFSEISPVIEKDIAMILTRRCFSVKKPIVVRALVSDFFPESPAHITSVLNPPAFHSRESCFKPIAP